VNAAAQADVFTFFEIEFKDDLYRGILKKDQYVNPLKERTIYPQNINIYVRSDKFIYPNTTNKAV
jgi:hypothetical protein